MTHAWVMTVSIQSLNFRSSIMLLTFEPILLFGPIKIALIFIEFFSFKISFLAWQYFFQIRAQNGNFFWSAEIHFLILWIHESRNMDFLCHEINWFSLSTRFKAMFQTCTRRDFCLLKCMYFCQGGKYYDFVIHIIRQNAF